MDDKIKIDLSVSDETTETKRNSQARDWCKTRLRRCVPNNELRVRLDRRLQRRKDIVFGRVPKFFQNLGNTGLSGRAADTHTRAAL